MKTFAYKSLFVAMLVLTAGISSVSAQSIIVLSGDATGTDDKTAYSWPDLDDFETNSNVSNLGTRTSAPASSGISVASDGSFYLLERDATASGIASLISWDSISSYTAGDSGTSLGTTGSLGESSGFTILDNGTVLFLEGTATHAGNRTLYSWTNIASFVAGDAGTDLGTRHLDPGLGFSAAGGSVYFLEGDPTNTGTKRILLWPTITDFVNDTNTVTYASTEHAESAGMSIVPEPSSALLLLTGGGIMVLLRRKHC